MNELVAVLDEAQCRELAPVMMSCDDSELVRKCQDGDQSAFCQLVDKHKRQAYWIAFDLTSNHETARDISQDAFIKAFKSISTFNSDNSFAGWLRKIVTNLSIDELRSRARKSDVSLEVVTEGSEIPSRHENSPAERLEAEEERGLVLRMLDKLPPKYRTVLVLRDIQGLSYEEIARMISRPRATVRWRIHNARKLFKDLWERHVTARGAKEE
ncbi:MAG: sigma-70 family RNA polymerase sigma factor [Planctomycetes bacterium]|nr:sigma-70 family RNA polymerase sigma factor [Planctomycetota bacterium]